MSSPRHFRLPLVVAVGVLVGVVSGILRAQSTASGTLSVNITSVAALSISSATLTFPDADPDLVPQVPSSQGPLTVTARARAARNATVTLTVLAADDLRSGISTIPAGALTWTGTGAGFVSGTVSRTAPQLVASWSGSGNRTGAQDYRFRNQWTYPSGTYSVTLLYTLTAP